MEISTIDNITSDPNQKVTLKLADQTEVVIELYYSDTQKGWFIRSLTYGSIVLRSLRVTNNVNMLRQWRNLLGFGLMCKTINNREPTLIQDFSSGNAVLSILDAESVNAYEKTGGD